MSLTLGDVEASLRQCRLSSGKINSSSLLGERPRGVVWRAADGTDSSMIEPLRVFSCRKMTGTRPINDCKRHNVDSKGLYHIFFYLFFPWGWSYLCCIHNYIMALKKSKEFTVKPQRFFEWTFSFCEVTVMLYVFCN